MSAELAARRGAAAAVLADYTHAAATADVAGRALWAARLAGMLAYLISAFDALDGAPLQAPAKQLEEIRLVLESSGWQASPPDIFALKDAADDWQCALEQIDDIVKRGAAGQAPIAADADAAWLRERAAETLRLRGRVAGLADALDASAAVTAPSRKSEIERETAARIRSVLEG